MNSTILDKILNLKKELNNEKSVVMLKKLDDELSNNEDVMRLAYKKDMASVEYENALKHFNESSQEVKSAQEKLYQAKLELDSHPLVIEYNKVYKEVCLLYKKINNELFGEFNSLGDISCD